MNRLSKLQLVGPIFLFVVILAAEAATYTLSAFPSSETLWYVNLKLFGLFQRNYYLLGSRTGIASFDLVVIAIPILLIGCLGVVCRRRLLLAISSNLSFVYAGYLIYLWTVMKSDALLASLSAIALPDGGADFYLVVSLLGASLLSFIVSHFLYVRDVHAAR